MATKEDQAHIDRFRGRPCHPERYGEEPWFVVAGVPYWGTLSRSGQCRAWSDSGRSAFVVSGASWGHVKSRLARRHGLLRDAVTVRRDLAASVRS